MEQDIPGFAAIGAFLTELQAGLGLADIIGVAFNGNGLGEFSGLDLCNDRIDCSLGLG